MFPPAGSAAGLILPSYHRWNPQKLILSTYGARPGPPRPGQRAGGFVSSAAAVQRSVWPVNRWAAITSVAHAAIAAPSVTSSAGPFCFFARLQLKLFCMEPNLESLVVAASFHLHEGGRRRPQAGLSRRLFANQHEAQVEIQHLENEALVVLLTCAGPSFELELLLPLRVFLLLHSRL